MLKMPACTVPRWSTLWTAFSSGSNGRETRESSTVCARRGRFIRCPISAMALDCSRKLWISAASIRRAARRRSMISRANLRRGQNEEGSTHYSVTGPALGAVGSGGAKGFFGRGTCRVAAGFRQIVQTPGTGAGGSSRRRGEDRSRRAINTGSAGRVLHGYLRKLEGDRRGCLERQSAQPRESDGGEGAVLCPAARRTATAVSRNHVDGT